MTALAVDTPHTGAFDRSSSEALFVRYRATDDIVLRNRLVEACLPLAARVAARYARSGEPADDLRQVAALALVKAIDRYDPCRGVPFASFAVPTIAGELKRHLRDNRWALHVPRNLQELAQRVAKENDRLTSRLGRVPTIREVAAAVGAEVEDVIEARVALQCMDSSSLDAPLADGEGNEDSVADRIGSLDGGYELVDDRHALADALARLPARQRAALRLRFHEDMTQSEIAARLGVSQMQVSRMLRHSLERLRAFAEPAA